MTQRFVGEDETKLTFATDEVAEDDDIASGDIRSDARSIPLPDECLDEVMGIHCIEHFEPWEAVKVLKEAHRMLKPGGKLVLEAPDVIKCAINLLQATTTREPTIAMNFGLWGFYGEPSEQNPYMIHKWGYWPESLCHLVTECGFKNAQSFVAETHAKDIRDFRAEAYK